MAPYPATPLYHTIYAKLTGLNAVVLHVKDPHGWIRWKSKNKLAREMGAIASNGLVEHTLRRLKEQGFWCIAKLDVFVDHKLVYKNPYMGTMDRILAAREIPFSRITDAIVF